MKTNEVIVLALVAIAAFVGAFVASYMIPCAAAFNQPQEDGLGPYRDYTMKIAPIEQTVVTEGTLFVKMQCGYNLFNEKISIQELVKTNPGYAIGNGDRVAPGVVETNFATIGGAREFDIRADGTFDTQIPAGTYVVTLNDGNAGFPEQAIVVIKPTQTVTVSFLGHAVSGLEEVKQRVVTITSALYGKIIKVIDSPAIPGQPAQTHVDYEAGHVHAKEVHGFAPHDFFYQGHKYQIVQNNEHYPAFDYEGYFGTHPAQLVTIVDVPAIPAQPEQFHYVGSIVDVTAQVQSVVDQGIFTFKFDNAQNPGGIFSGSTLVAQIDDPAFGVLKDVVIVADGQTINAQEYETINV